MALITPGPLAGEVSGSLGNTVFSRNRGGAYLRMRAKPVNPNTPPQQDQRSALNDAIQYWTNSLSLVNRDLWNTYAANVPVINRLGNPVLITGQNHFVRSNAVAIRIGAPVIEAAPVIFDTGEPPATFSINDATAPDSLDIDIDNTEPWANEDGSFLVVAQFLPVNVTVNPSHVRRQFAQAIEGDSVTPPTSPVSLISPIPFSFATGQRITVSARILRADGRLSQLVEAAPFTAL